MTAKHTPRPWAHHNTPTPFIYVNAGGLPICQIYTSTAHGQSMGEQFANAHLIAAAPELLEAAKLVLEWYEAEDNHSGTDFYQRMQMCRDSEDAIRAAIAKATGE